MEYVIPGLLAYVVGGIFSVFVAYGMMIRAGSRPLDDINGCLGFLFALVFVFSVWPVYMLLWLAGMFVRALTGR